MKMKDTLATWSHDRSGAIVAPYATYEGAKARKIIKQRKANKVARKQRKINRKRNKK